MGGSALTTAASTHNLCPNQAQKRWQVGWYRDNYIGSTAQINLWHDDWHDFYAQQRLGYQLRLAVERGLLDRPTVRHIERLQYKLADYLPPCPRPSLLHGDLWAGNALISATGEGYLLDPAVYVGHPETDIAMTRLFGGFDAEFYDAYSQHCPIEAGFEERVDIYHLYHYLNHLNLFGTAYLPAVQRIAAYFGNRRD